MAHPHGVRITEKSEGVRQLSGRSTNVIGIVATAPDADDTLFPLDGLSLITDVDYALSKAGLQGTLAPTLEAIAYQCKPIICVARVAQSDVVATQASNVIGAVAENGDRTGLKALESAAATLGARPKILACPGLDTQPVTTAMVAAAKRLRAMSYARAQGSSVSAAITYRANYSDRELMLLYPHFRRWNTTANAYDTGFASAYAAGLRAKIDSTLGWAKTLSNVPVSGVTGLSQTLTWDLLSGDNDVGLLNDNEITGLIRSPDGGFRFWGNRTCSDDPLFSFESATRAAHVLHELIGEGLMWAVDRGLTPRHAKDVIETIQAGIDGEVNAGNLIGGSVWMSEGANTPTTLSGGGLYLDYDYTPVAPLECIHLAQRITSRYYLDFATSLVSSVATA